MGWRWQAFQAALVDQPDAKPADHEQVVVRVVRRIRDELHGRRDRQVADLYAVEELARPLVTAHSRWTAPGDTDPEQIPLAELPLRLSPP